jgi:hypothetical protein
MSYDPPPSPPYGPDDQQGQYPQYPQYPQYAQYPTFGYAYYGPPPQYRPPPTYLGWAIAMIALGGLVGAIPGVIALVQSGKVMPRWHAGDLAGAKRASEATKWWCIAGSALWAIAAVVVLIAIR